MQEQHLKEIYRTWRGCIYQDNQHNMLVLEWCGRRSMLKLPCFFSLKKLASKINVEALLVNTGRDHDLEILTPCGCDRCFVLTISEVLEFQDLLNGTRAMMELNSIVHERLQRSFACI